MMMMISTKFVKKDKQFYEWERYFAAKKNALKNTDRRDALLKMMF